MCPSDAIVPNLQEFDHNDDPSIRRVSAEEIQAQLDEFKTVSFFKWADKIQENCDIEADKFEQARLYLLYSDIKRIYDNCLTYGEDFEKRLDTIYQQEIEFKIAREKDKDIRLSGDKALICRHFHYTSSIEPAVSQKGASAHVERQTALIREQQVQQNETAVSHLERSEPFEQRLIANSQSTTAKSHQLDAVIVEQRQAKFREQFNQQLQSRTPSPLNDTNPSQNTRPEAPTAPTATRRQANFREQFRQQLQNRAPNPQRDTSANQADQGGHSVRDPLAASQSHNATSPGPDAPTVAQRQADFIQQFQQQLQERASSPRNDASSPQNDVSASQNDVSASQSENPASQSALTAEQIQAEFVQQFHQQLQHRTRSASQTSKSSASSSKNNSPSTRDASSEPQLGHSTPPTEPEIDPPRSQNAHTEAHSGSSTPAPQPENVTPEVAARRRWIRNRAAREGAAAKKFQAEILAKSKHPDCTDKTTLTLKRGAWKVAPFEKRVPKSYVEFGEEEGKKYMEMPFETISCLGIL